MSNTEENAAVRDAADAVVDYERSLEGYIQERPLTAIAVSLVVGALLAKFLF